MPRRPISPDGRLFPRTPFECSGCGKIGAETRAQCGCMYHTKCVRDLVVMGPEEGRPLWEINCHGHNLPMTQTFVALHAPGFTLFPDDASGPGTPTAATQSRSLRDDPSSSMSASMSTTLQRAFGVPCVLCFSEEGLLKTLHCGVKVHPECFKKWWGATVAALGRLTDIPCPAERHTGCQKTLNPYDLRGLVNDRDIYTAIRDMKKVDRQNEALIEELKVLPRAMFKCEICLVEHEVEGCCTLPCGHRFCFESLQYHFENVVKERRLNRLLCPICDYDLRSEQHIHIFQEALTEETYIKLLDFLVRDNPRVCDCRHRGCEERVYLEVEDDFSHACCPRGHSFCTKCEYGPHRGMSCEEARAAKKRDAQAEEDEAFARKAAAGMGWKPCPRRCIHGGGFKVSNECDHMTCACGFEFCWQCGADRRVTVLHDNRWHKPSCKYHTKPSEVRERPKRVEACPECQKMPAGQCCRFPRDDGWPESYTGTPGLAMLGLGEPDSPLGAAVAETVVLTGPRNPPVAAAATIITEAPELMSTIQPGPECLLDCFKRAFHL